MGFRALQVENRKISRSNAPAIYRVLGFIARRARVNPSRFWFRFDAAEISDVLGISLRTVRTVKAKLEANPETYGYHWRTVFNHGHGSKGSWGIVYGPADRLKWDKEPLFNSVDGKPRHLRFNQRADTLSTPTRKGPGAIGIPDSQRHGAPADEPGEVQAGGSGTRAIASDSRTINKPEGSECSPYKREAMPLSRDTPWRGCGDVSAAGKRRLWAKAAAVGRRLEEFHWQFQRVDFSFLAARRLAFESILAGFLESEIRAAYERAIWEAAGYASDIGKQFNASSTIIRARRRLDADQRTRNERMNRFYET